MNESAVVIQVGPTVRRSMWVKAMCVTHSERDHPRVLILLLLSLQKPPSLWPTSMVMHWIPWMHCTANVFSILGGNSSEHKWEQFALFRVFCHILNVKIVCHKRQTQKKEFHRHKFPTSRTKIPKGFKRTQKDPKCNA